MTHTELSPIERAMAAEEIATVQDDDVPPYVRLKRGWCAKFRRACYSSECHTVCKLAP